MGTGRSCTFALLLGALVSSHARSASGLAADTRDECLVTLDVDGPPVTLTSRRFHVACTDCDPRCDHDGVTTPNGSCTFRVRTCVNDLAEPECEPGVVHRIRVRPRGLGLTLPVLPSAAAPACGEPSAMLEVPVAQEHGTASRRIVVKARARGSDAQRLRDADRYTFACAPRTESERCPPPEPVCGDGVITPPEQCDPGITPDGCGSGTVCRTAGDDACRCTPCNAAGSATHTLVLTARGGPSFCDSSVGDTPAAGEVRDASEQVLAPVYPSCLYAGGGFGALVARLEAGPRRALTVTAPAGCLAGEVTVGASGATGGLLAAGCTEPGCLFAAPLPVFNTALSSCIAPVVNGDVHGTLDVDRGTLSLEVPLALAVYLTTAEIRPCPVCIGGICQGGAVDGAACDASDPYSCPIGGSLLGTIPVTLPLGTTPATRREESGFFCPAQLDAGALGHPTARRVTVTGAGAGYPLTTGQSFDLDLAGLVCFPSSGTAVLDGTSDLPGLGALALPLRAQID